MIFSIQKLQTAMGYLAGCYDKIIFVDLNTNSWEPIKVSKEEYDEAKGLSLKNWLYVFESNRKIVGFKSHEIIDVIDNNIPYSTNYIKSINNEFHKVTLEYLPTGDKQGYILVFDHDTFERGRTCEEV